MPSELDRATALQSQSAERFNGQISEAFWVQSGPNGGYLSTIALRGACAVVKEEARVPRSLHVRFLAAPKAGAFELHASVTRSGRSMTSVEVQMRQDDRDFLHASACFSEAFAPIAFQDATMPEALPYEKAEPLPKRIALNHRYDLRRAIGGRERASERALSGGWVAFADSRPFDALALAAVWDAWPPAIFTRQLAQRFRGAVPTVEVSVYFRRRLPLPDARPCSRVLLRVETLKADEGLIEESGEAWSDDGILLMQSRQLALLL